MQQQGLFSHRKPVQIAHQSMLGVALQEKQQEKQPMPQRQRMQPWAQLVLELLG
jgi:hypothetical protein